MLNDSGTSKDSCVRACIHSVMWHRATPGFQMEASILSQTHQGTIKKYSFLVSSQNSSLSNRCQKMRKIILTHKCFAKSPRDPNHEMFFLTAVNCVTCLFVQKRQVTQLTSVKKTISWFGSRSDLAKNLWVEILLRIFWRPVRAGES